MHPLLDTIAEIDITSSQTVVLLALFRRMDGMGQCFPSYKDLLKFTKLSRPTLSKCITALSKEGLISYEKGNSHGRSNSYQLNLGRLGLSEPENVIKIGQPKSKDVGELVQVNGRYYAKHEIK